MRKLVFGALLLGSLGMASGCIISSDDDDDDNGGRFSMTWTLESGGSEITCTDAGAGGVASLATLAGTTQGVEDIFTCENGNGTTGILPLGDYTVVVSVLEEGTDAALGTSMPRSESLIDPGVTEDLGDFIFDFPPAAVSLSFTVDYGAASGSNCSGGAGGEIVDDQNTNLVITGNSQCISVPIMVGTTQEVSDICSELATCIESDVIQTLPDLDPGTYDLLLEGLITDTGSGDSIACFRSLDVNINLNDGDEDLGVLLVPFDDTDDSAFCATI